MLELSYHVFSFERQSYGHIGRPLSLVTFFCVVNSVYMQDHMSNFTWVCCCNTRLVAGFGQCEDSATKDQQPGRVGWQQLWQCAQPESARPQQQPICLHLQHEKFQRLAQFYQVRRVYFTNVFHSHKASMEKWNCTYKTALHTSPKVKWNCTYKSALHTSRKSKWNCTYKLAFHTSFKVKRNCTHKSGFHTSPKMKWNRRYALDVRIFFTILVK